MPVSRPLSYGFPIFENYSFPMRSPELTKREEMIANHSFEMSTCSICLERSISNLNLREMCKKENPGWFLSKEIEQFHVVEYLGWENTKINEIKASIQAVMCLVLKLSTADQKFFSVCPLHLTELAERLIDAAYGEEDPTDYSGTV